jgi:hypothetical protein
MNIHAESCFSKWYPTIENMLGIKTPLTWWTKTDLPLMQIPYGERVDGFDEFCQELSRRAAEIGTPCFLRTGQTSGKHQWRDTCYLASSDVETVGHHVCRLLDHSAVVDFFFGLPVDVWVLRKMLKATPVFHAEVFGGMPVTREFRLFVNNGRVVHFQPYWPAGAFSSMEDHSKYDELPADWAQKLALMNEIGEIERSVLECLSVYVGKEIGGFWSIDWLWAENDWWLTDMAQGQVSYAYNPETGEEFEAASLLVL